MRLCFSLNFTWKSDKFSVTLSRLLIQKLYFLLNQIWGTTSGKIIIEGKAQIPVISITRGHARYVAGNLKKTSQIVEPRPRVLISSTLCVTGLIYALSF